MILIGIGGNLSSEKYGPPRATCGAALALLEDHGIRVIKRSRWFESAPVPASDQPWYVNGVVAVDCALDPVELIAKILNIEAELGRERGELNAARIVDLDLLAYDSTVLDGDRREEATVPHPRMTERAFVLLPMQDVAPSWRHPSTGQGIDELIAQLPKDQTCRPLKDSNGAYGTEWKA